MLLKWQFMSNVSRPMTQTFCTSLPGILCSSGCWHVSRPMIRTFCKSLPGILCSSGCWHVSRPMIRTFCKSLPGILCSSGCWHVSWPMIRTFCKSLPGILCSSGCWHVSRPMIQTFCKSLPGILCSSGCWHVSRPMIRTFCKSLPGILCSSGCWHVSRPMIRTFCKSLPGILCSSGCWHRSSWVQNWQNPTPQPSMAPWNKRNTIWTSIKNRIVSLCNRCFVTHFYWNIVSQWAAFAWMNGSRVLCSLRLVTWWSLQWWMQSVVITEASPGDHCTDGPECSVYWGVSPGDHCSDGSRVLFTEACHLVIITVMEAVFCSLRRVT